MILPAHARIRTMRGMVIYCERSSFGFWEEPLNALTNIAFVIAAVAAWRVYRGLRAAADGHRRWDLLLMLGSLAGVGVGGFLWHTLAAPWTEWADVIPILMFLNLYVVSLLYRGAGLATPAVLVLFLVFQWVMTVAATRFPGEFLNGAASYVPAVGMLWLAALYSASRLGGHAWPAIAAAAVFTASLGLRSLDLTVCPTVPTGTHFLWHLLNALALYLAFVGLVRLIKARQGGAGTLRQGLTASS